MAERVQNNSSFLEVLRLATVQKTVLPRSPFLVALESATHPDTTIQRTEEEAAQAASVRAATEVPLITVMVILGEDLVPEEAVLGR
jgi:hypothetical protein